MASPVLDKLPYTINNLPYGVISTSDEPKPRCAVAIGEHAVDLAKYAKEGRLDKIDMPKDVFAENTLNTFAALDWSIRRDVRAKIQEDLKNGAVPARCLVQLKDVKEHLPMKMGGFSDFYTSLEHCQNCSGLTAAKIFKNWFYAPSVYNSRVSSVVPTSTTIPRPSNIYFKEGIDSEPAYGPTRKLDFELEMGYFVSKPVPYGSTLPIEQAKEHIFGFVLLNDWSARDHQLFEMRPLGPFHSKGFGTSIGTWVTPLEALEPFACAPNTKPDPPTFPHLTYPDWDTAALDVKLKITLVRNGSSTILGTSNLKYMYWTPYQQLTHHVASGCGMETGDLIGTGTISGAGTNEKGEKAELGCLYEHEMTGTKAMPKGTGTYLEGYLEDGDEVIFEGWCERDGRVVLGFGECRGVIAGPK